MPAIATLPRTSPLDKLREGLRVRGSDAPCPLVATRLAVALRAGFASVAVVRTFRNAEASPIEAVLTIPVPTAAVVHGLGVRVGDRVLHAVAQGKATARDTYEAAVDEGRVAVLHEEAMKGIHVLSIGQIPPGQSVEVGILWAQPLQVSGDVATLRIPTTVGEVYGRDTLEPSDALLADGPNARAPLAVSGAPRGALVCGGPISADGDHVVDLDLPITVTVPASSTQAVLAGRGMDGRRVSLSIEPAPAGEEPLDVGVLFDASQSTRDSFTGVTSRSTADVTRAGLTSALGRIGRGDRVSVWSFNTTARSHGRQTGPEAAGLMGTLPRPEGGTEVGVAIETLAAREGARDVLVVSDGRSRNVDPLRIAGLGLRVSAILCGPDSLDSKLGEVVAMTGGQMIVVGAPGEDHATVDRAATTLFGQMRRSGRTDALGRHAFGDAILARRGGLDIEARWDDGVAGTLAIGRDATQALVPHLGAGECDAVGAYAAWLALPRLHEDEAMRVAVGHGLCTHLTSLVVVDRTGETSPGVPSQRKVPLSRPRGGAIVASGAPMAKGGALRSLHASPRDATGLPRATFSSRRAGSDDLGLDATASPVAWDARSRSRVGPDGAGPKANARGPALDLLAVGARVDWNAWGADLAKGDLSSLNGDLRQAILRAAETAALVALAAEAGVAAVVAVMALMARNGGGRTAARVGRLLSGTSASALASARRVLEAAG